MGGESRAVTMVGASHRKMGPGEEEEVDIAEGEEAVLAVALQEGATEVQWAVQDGVVVGVAEP